MEAPRRADTDGLPPLALVPAPRPLTLDDIRGQIAAREQEARGGLWVVTCQQRYAVAHYLIGIYTSPADALAAIADEIETERQELPATQVSAEAEHDEAWEITVGAVVLRLEWSTVIEPRPKAER